MKVEHEVKLGKTETSLFSYRWVLEPFSLSVCWINKVDWDRFDLLNVNTMPVGSSLVLYKIFTCAQKLAWLITAWNKKERK